MLRDCAHIVCSQNSEGPSVERQTDEKVNAYKYPRALVYLQNAHFCSVRGVRSEQQDRLDTSGRDRTDGEIERSKERHALIAENTPESAHDDPDQEENQGLKSCSEISVQRSFRVEGLGFRKREE
jgi:hypothetical protein